MNLNLKAPESLEDQEVLAGQAPNYACTIAYLSRFIELRTNMGDMSTREVMDEIEHNICVTMRQGFDRLGTH